MRAHKYVMKKLNCNIYFPVDIIVAQLNSCRRIYILYYYYYTQSGRTASTGIQNLVCVFHAGEPVRYRISWHARRVVNSHSLPRPTLPAQNGRDTSVSAVIIIFKQQVCDIELKILNQLHRRHLRFSPPKWLCYNFRSPYV